MNYLTIHFNNKLYNVTKTSHSSESRNAAVCSRDFGVSKQGFESILLQAFKYGLNSFRNSKVVITFNDHVERRISILIEHKDDTIVIISIFRNWDMDDFKANYITVKNRINLTHHWSLPKPGEDGNKFFPKPVKLIQSKKNVKNRIRIVKRNDDAR